MVRTLYHGSPNIIEKPIYGYGKPYNDYGLGFYCTGSLDMAKEWGGGKDRDKSARREYFSVERNRRQKGDLYITQIMDEEMMPGDARLR